MFKMGFIYSNVLKIYNMFKVIGTRVYMYFESFMAIFPLDHHRLDSNPQT
jgi:hypothetical protein